ncbi:MAG: hypothetical protein JEY71_14155 [Sphaerochaeta sp.]|nr:hypothetical protein [Sphaerochaeta sp.]
MRLNTFLSYPDDLAQIVGTNSPVVEATSESSSLIKLSENCNALVLGNVGALCRTTTRGDEVCVSEKYSKIAQGEDA